MNYISRYTSSLGQNPYTLGESITVQLTTCLTGLDSIKTVKLMLIQHKQCSLIQTK